MASGKVQGAASGASAGAKIGSVVPGVGSGIGAAVGAVAGALFGGSGTYAQDQGYEITGQLSASGFQGSVVGVSSNAGEVYRNAATGELKYLNLTAADRWKKFGLTDQDAPIPFTFSIPYDFNLAFQAVEDVIKGAVAKKSDPLSPLLSAFGVASPIQAPTVARSAVSAPSVAAAGDPVGIVLAPAASPQPGSGVGLLALLAGAFYAVTHV